MKTLPRRDKLEIKKKEKKRNLKCYTLSNLNIFYLKRRARRNDLVLMWRLNILFCRTPYAIPLDKKLRQFRLRFRDHRCLPNDNVVDCDRKCLIKLEKLL